MEAPRAKDAVAYAAQRKFLDEAALAAKHPLEDITAAAAQIQADKAHFPQGNLLGELLGIADTFAVWLVRSEFMRIAEAIPASNVGHADYWYRHWKRSGGDPEALKRRFALAADEADRLLSLHGLGLSEPNRDPSTELAYRERALLVSPEKKQANRRVGGLTASAAASPSADVAPVPSTRAVELIVEHESGGYDYYLRILRERAHWPGGLSGVTIGFGFDLGYQSRGDLELAWGAELAAADLRRIGEVLGLKAKENDQASVRLLRDATARLADIAIPWDAAVRVFNAHTVPVEVQRTANALENAIMLPPDCFGALVSLVFNRGASFGKSGPRYQEMRAIAAHMRAREFARIPQELRSMKRLWDPVQLGGLHRRREDEARLFERGLGV